MIMHGLIGDCEKVLEKHLAYHYEMYGLSIEDSMSETFVDGWAEEYGWERILADSGDCVISMIRAIVMKVYGIDTL